jgi:hypothetical protein
MIITNTSNLIATGGQGLIDCDMTSFFCVELSVNGAQAISRAHQSDA